MATKKITEIVVELEGFAHTEAQLKAISDLVKGAVVQGLSKSGKDGLLVRATTVSKKGGARMGFARVGPAGSM